MRLLEVLTEGYSEWACNGKYGMVNTEYVDGAFGKNLDAAQSRIALFWGEIVK